jgi:succinate dehydrogenase / fumarate reductase cytochrome b subunit
MRQKNFFSSTPGTKVFIALTGLCLFAYLILHLAGNLLFFLGPNAFNGYSHFLISNPLIYPIEIALALIFIFHILETVTMWLENRKARPVPYVKKKWAGGKSRKTVASSTMIYTGLWVLLFVIIHLQGFKFGMDYQTRDTGIQVRDLYRLEVEQFSNPLTVAFYIVSMILIGFHLWHGLWSSTQSLGVENSTQSKRLLQVGKVVAVLIAGGFIFIPIYVYVVGGRQ